MLAERIERHVSGAPPRPPLSVPNPMDATRHVRGVLFDLDGTLYRQRPMRALMAAELGMLAISRPLRAPIIWRVLSEFRKAQESLRTATSSRQAPDQLDIAARRTGMPVDQVEAIVGEWMIERPLKHLPRCRAEGLIPLPDFLSLLRVHHAG